MVYARFLLIAVNGLFCTVYYSAEIIKVMELTEYYSKVFILSFDIKNFCLYEESGEICYGLAMRILYVSCYVLACSRERSVVIDCDRCL